MIDLTTAHQLECQLESLRQKRVEIENAIEEIKMLLKSGPEAQNGIDYGSKIGDIGVVVESTLPPFAITERSATVTIR